MPHLKSNEFVFIVKSTMLQPNLPPNWIDVELIVSKKLQVLNDRKLNDKISKLKKEFNKQLKVNNNHHSANREVNDYICINSDNLTPFAENNEPSAKRMKHLDNLSSRKQLVWPTGQLFSDIATFAQQENISIYRLLGLL